MFRILQTCVGCLVMLSMACSTGTDRVSLEKPGSGWKVLFDGTSLAAWKGFKTDTVGSGWQIVDGTLHRAGQGGDLVTKDQFGDFELTLDWKVGGAGNSGIF